MIGDPRVMAELARQLHEAFTISMASPFDDHMNSLSDRLLESGAFIRSTLDCGIIEASIPFRPSKPTPSVGGFMVGIALRDADPERRKQYMRTYYHAFKSESRAWKVRIRRRLLQTRVAH